MTGGRTSHSTSELWTGIITLLLFTATVHSQSSVALDNTAPSPLAGTIEDPSGSNAPLRKTDRIVDVPSTTSKYIGDRPEAHSDVGTIDNKNVAAESANKSQISKPKNEDRSQSKKADFEVTHGKLSRIEGNGEASEGFLSEFNEKEDYGDIDELEEDNSREPTTPRTKNEVDNGNTDQEDRRVKENNGNVGTSEKREEEGFDKKMPKNPGVEISLANDTNVNYNVKKTVKGSKDDGILGNDSKDLKNVLENATNVISSGDNGDTQEKGKGPKSQVEVVKNSTTSKIQRISVFSDIEKEKKDVIEDFYETTSANHEFNTEATIVHDEKNDKSMISNSGDVDSQKTNDTKTLQIPKGRTISFGGTNEFVVNENKTSGLSKEIIGVTDRSIVAEVTDQKTTDFRPYPYLKTTDQRNESVFHVPYSQEADIQESTEEVSALENTIGQRQQDKKFVVTEPSVVIDNSIQQFKSTYFKRTGNSSRITSSIDSTVSTTVSNLEGRDTTSSSESIASKNDTTVIVESSLTSNKENDVQPNKDDVTRSSIEAKDTSNGLDLTGNGITEVVNGKNYSDRSIDDSGRSNNDSEGLIEESVTKPTVPLTTSGIPISRATENTLVQMSTEKMVAINDDDKSLTNFDIQTDAENSKLIVSSLNVTEDSTRVPSTETASNVETSTISMPNLSSVSSSTTSSSSLSINIETQTTTIIPETSIDPVSRETLRFNDSLSSVDTSTSKVEYEFVGLTESTVSEKYIDSSESSNAVNDDKELVSSTPSSFVQSSTSFSTSTIRPNVQDSSIDGESTTEAAIESETSTQDVTSITDSGITEDSVTTFSSLDFTTQEESTITTEAEDSVVISTAVASGVLDNSSSVSDVSPSVSDVSPSVSDVSPFVSDVSPSVSDVSTSESNEFIETTTEEISSETNFTNLPGNLPDFKNTTDTGRAVDSSTTNAPEISESPGQSGSSNLTTIDSTETTIRSDVSDSFGHTETSTSHDSNFGSTVSSTESLMTSESQSPSTTSTQSSIMIVTYNIFEIDGRAVPPEELTSLVRIVFEGSWSDVCPHLSALRQSLADLLTSGLEKTVLANQIIFQKDPCTEGSSVTTEPSLTTLLLYVVDQNGNFDAEMTKTLPSLYEKSPIKLQVTIHSFQLVQDSDSGNAIAVVVVSCVAFICLVLLAGLLFIMRKRQTRFNYGERCRPVSLDAYSLDSVSAYNSVRRKGAARASKRSYGNPTFEDSSAIPSHPLNFAGLSTFCNEQNSITEEFIGIPQVAARNDELPPGAEVKNRYANVVPLPETRVSLMKINNDPLTEYINASYVRGPKNATKYYIACQAPMETTVTDFWRMIWEQQSKVIIMLTDLVENDVQKCAEYIPPSEVTDCHRLYGDFQVTLKKRETKEKYAISTLHLKNLENNTFREISHIWYLWPENGVQSDAAGLIAVLLEARALQRGGPGPIVVHCSPGTGRTGTLIALDLGIRQYEITRTVDVPRVVYTIRRDRAGAVQTKEQYAFIYKALNLYATKLAGGALES